MNRHRLRPGWLYAVALILWGVSPARAHPHILIDARSSILFNASGEAIAVRNTWVFDDAFSAFAIQGYDSKGDGLPTRDDLQPFAEINMRSLGEYNYFTKVAVDGAVVLLQKPVNFYDVFSDEKLTLRFTLPFSQPVDVHGRRLQLDVYDPEYFAAITFAQTQPIGFRGSAPDCNSVVRRPMSLDPAIASQLSVIPASQRTLPPALFAVTQQLANTAVVTCR